MPVCPPNLSWYFWWSYSPSGHPGLGERRIRSVLRIQAHDTPGCAAVQRGRGSADDFDTADRTDIDIVNPALTVGQCGRKIIDEDLDAADAEVGAGAEPPDCNPQVLAEVIAVLKEDTGHPGQRFVQTQLLAAGLDSIPFHYADCT